MHGANDDFQPVQVQRPTALRPCAATARLEEVDARDFKKKNGVILLRQVDFLEWYNKKLKTPGYICLMVNPDGDVHYGSSRTRSR